MLAGAAGFEPAHGGTKNRCLTAWLRPSRAAPYSGRCEDVKGRQDRRPRHHLRAARSISEPANADPKPMPYHLAPTRQGRSLKRKWRPQEAAEKAGEASGPRPAASHLSRGGREACGCAAALRGRSARPPRAMTELERDGKQRRSGSRQRPSGFSACLPKLAIPPACQAEQTTNFMLAM